MAKAFTFQIGPKLPNKKVSLGEENLVSQSSPTWVLTFVRWNIRDTLRTPTSDPNSVRRPMVIENDCIQVSVSDNKGTLTPNMSAVLMETDVNYSTELHPGDFVFVNMLNWEADARRVADKARAGLPINEISDGFKGFFKVQSVRKTIHSEPASGVRSVVTRVDGFAFTEFNNTIYFNPNLINQKILANQALFINDLSSAWASYVSKSGKPFLQEILAFLIQSLIGSGVNSSTAQIGGMVVSPNTHFLVPMLVGRLLGVVKTTNANSTDFSSTIAIKDIYHYLFGIQQYSAGAIQTLASGMNPSNNLNQAYPNFFYTDTFCPGNSLLKPEYWNQVKLWSILNQYTNAPLNELFTCFRVSPNGKVMPTLVFRQIPFTSEDFTTQKLGTQDENSPSIPVTKFLSLPRWKIGSEIVFTVDLGTDEAARINFVQYYARSNFSDKGIEIAGETALKNYVFDADDIARSGLRPYLVQNQFDDLPDAVIKFAPVWARVFGDAVIGGHLKLNGTVECIGMVDPIAVGDNLEFDGVVYHIEQVGHICSINQVTGNKTFRTTLSLSHGVSVNSSAQGTLYSQMTYSDAYKDRQHDFQNQQMLPGVSESQDVVYRPKNLDIPHSGGAPFQQPTVVKNQKKTGE